MIRNKIKKSKHKKLINKSKGFNKSNLFRLSNQKYIRKLTNQYISRKLKKRIFRTKWIKFINIQLKTINLKYSLFISSLKRQSILLNRKMLYFILLNDLLKK